MARLNAVEASLERTIDDRAVLVSNEVEELRRDLRDLVDPLPSSFDEV
jgi:hypothetical protein